MTTTTTALRITGAVLVLAAAGLSLPADAAAEPHVRNGLYAGFSYGGTWAKLDFGDDDQDSQWSNTLGARAGWALDQDLLVGAEFTRWAKDYEIATLQGDIPYEVTLVAALAMVTYFPGNAGFTLRGGLGAAVAEADITPPAQFGVEATSVSTDPGFAGLVSAGYEARLTGKFALGATFDVMYLGVSEGALEQAYLYGLNLHFNWYW